MFPISRQTLQSAVSVWISIVFLSVERTHQTSAGCYMLPRNANKPGIRLQGHFIYSFASSGRVNCLNACFEVTACSSVNLQIGTDLCELNSANSSTAAASDLVSNGTFVLLDIQLWSKMGGGCVDKPCSSNQRCISSGKDFRCIETICPIILTPPHGTITYSGSSVGSIATLSCASGYSPFPDDSGTTRWCLTNSSWEIPRPSPTCQPDSLGSSCSADGQCKEGNSRCLYSGDAGMGSKCVCKPLHEYNRTKRACVKVCKRYLNTLAETTGKYLANYDMFTVEVIGVDLGWAVLSVDACLGYCTSTFGEEVPGFDIVALPLVPKLCYCSSLSWQQALDAVPDIIGTGASRTYYERGCEQV